MEDSDPILERIYNDVKIVLKDFKNCPLVVINNNCRCSEPRFSIIVDTRELLLIVDNASKIHNERKVQLIVEENVVYRIEELQGQVRQLQSSLNKPLRVSIQ